MIHLRLAHRPPETSPPISTSISIAQRSGHSGSALSVRALSFASLLLTLVVVTPAGLATASADTLPALPTLEEYPEELSYQEFPDASPAQVERELAKIEPIALAQGLEPIGFDESGVRHSVLDMSEVYANFDCDQMLVVKFNALPAQRKFVGKLIVDGPHALLYHGKTASGLPYAIYTSELGSARSHDFVSRVRAALSATPGLRPEAALEPRPRGAGRILRALSRMGDHLIPSAEAYETSAKQASCAPGVASSTVDPKEVRKGISRNATHTFVRVLVGCGKGIGTGLFNATIGAAGDLISLTLKVGKGALYFVHKPFEAVHKALNYAAAFPRKVLDSLKSHKDDVKKFDAEKWAHLFCQIATEVGVGVAIGMLATGRIPALAGRLTKESSAAFQQATQMGGPIGFFVNGPAIDRY